MEKIQSNNICDDCGVPIGQDNGPPDGWQLEDGRTVCHKCCCHDTRKVALQTAMLMIEYIQIKAHGKQIKKD